MITKFLDEFMAGAAKDPKHAALALYPLMRIAKGCDMITTIMAHPELEYDDRRLLFTHSSGATLQFGSVHSKYDLKRFQWKRIDQLAVHHGVSADVMDAALRLLPQGGVVLI